MRIYKCDACGKTIDDPHKVEMKEFYVGCNFSIIPGRVLPMDETRRIKIHICNDCFKGLNLIAEKVRGEKKC